MGDLGEPGAHNCLWISDLMRSHIKFKSAGDKELFLFDGPTPIGSFDELGGMHSVASLPLIPAADAHDQVLFQCAIFQMPKAAGRVYCSVPSLFEQLNLEMRGGRPCEWFHHTTSRWTTLIDRYDLGVDAQRSSRPYTRDESGLDIWQGRDGRYLTYPSLNTALLSAA